MSPISLFIPASPNFSFQSTVYSHGWSELRPFNLDRQNWRLTYVFSDEKGRNVSGVMGESPGGGVTVKLASKHIDLLKVERDVRHVLRLDDDLTSFYRLLDGHDHLSWIRERRAGRLLRSATVYEDLVKTLCTTNCSWGLTRIMVRNLVEKLGEPAAGGGFAFPTATAMSRVGADFYRTEVKSGYRSQYLLDLARSVADGVLDPESWLDSPLPGLELRNEIKNVKGVGDYAADNLLKLIGKYDGLALDSWLRSQFYKKYNNQKPCPDARIERRYKQFGSWRGLVIWCDMTEKWIE